MSHPALPLRHGVLVVQNVGQRLLKAFQSSPILGRAQHCADIFGHLHGNRQHQQGRQARILRKAAERLLRAIAVLIKALSLACSLATLPCLRLVAGSTVYGALPC